MDRSKKESWPSQPATEQLQELPPTLTVPEVARVLRISRGAAYEAIRSGQIQAVRIGRTLRVSRHAVACLLDTTSGEAK